MPFHAFINRPAMAASIWYISKYFGLPSDRVGARPFMLMREFARANVKPTIFCANMNHLFDGPLFEGSHMLQSVDGIDICWLRIRPYRGAQSIGRILSWIEFEWRLWRLPKSRFARPDAIIVSSLSLFTILNGLLLRQKFKCRLVFEVRDIWPLTLVEEGGFSRWNPFVMALQWLEKFGYHHADSIVGTMPNLQEHVTGLIGDGPAVHCIPMGVDDSQLADPTPLPEDYRQRHVPCGKFIVCHAGTIGSTNALGTLLETARLMKNNDKVHFLVVGDGDMKEQHERSVADLANISFAPAVPKSMVQSLLQVCDLLYFSTYKSKVWDYGQSLNKVVDYMLAGKPIVASFSGYPSMINEAKCGKFVPAGDAYALRDAVVRFSAMDANARKAMGDSARRWIASNRNYRTLSKDYLRILQIKPTS